MNEIALQFATVNNQMNESVVATTCARGFHRGEPRMIRLRASVNCYCHELEVSGPPKASNMIFISFSTSPFRRSP
jgi:hypothetical protein